jgi:D-alanyl-D-alanine carboxypeptidase/S-layer homology domain
MCVILVLALLAMAPAPAQAAQPACPSLSQLPPTPFVDLVSATHRSAIACAGWYDLTRGITATRFGPLGAVRRDQMAAFLARTAVAANVPLPSEPPQPFTDVAASAHRDAIAQMAELDLVRGTHDGLFEPAAPVRRGQMAAFLVRLAQHLGVEAPAGDDVFADDDGTVHEHDINVAAALGLTKGISATSFAPGRRIRREQMASFLARLVEVLVDRGVLKRRPIPTYTSSVTAVPRQMRAAMSGASWHRGCPVSIDRLALLTVTHWDFNAEPRRGHLIVARSVADDLAGVFRRIYAARFQIEHIRPMHTYEGRELASLNDNNTSAFDCRKVTGGSSWSEHSYGTAVDINPRQNPYSKGAILLPANSRPWVARTPVRRGMISPAGPVTRAFKAIGWGWGGDYRSLKDYQHFSASGR